MKSRIRALVVGENQWLLLAVARALGAAGIRVEIASPQDASPVRWSRHCRKYWRLPAGWGDETRDAIARALETGLDVAVPADFPAARLLSQQGGTFPLASLEQLDLANDKARF